MKEIDGYFSGKPITREIFDVIRAKIDAATQNTVEVGSQISFAARRKFAWIWLYNVTKQNWNGVLHLMLRLDRRAEHPGIREITQVSKDRWNHQIVVRSVDDAKATWLGDLIDEACVFGNRP